MIHLLKLITSFILGACVGGSITSQILGTDSWEGYVPTFMLACLVRLFIIEHENIER